MRYLAGIGNALDLGRHGGGDVVSNWARRAEGYASRSTAGDYLRAIGRRKVVVALGVAAGLVLGAVALPAMLPNQGTYQATIRLKVA
jgi:hypothetical protein